MSGYSTYSYSQALTASERVSSPSVGAIRIESARVYESTGVCSVEGKIAEAP